ncbi:MAG: hypothetical protein QM730_20215 [Anaerolineales bacterium]
MNKMLFSPRKFFPLIATVLALMLAILACGGTSASPQLTQASPSDISPTQSSPSEPIMPVPTMQPAVPERRLLTVEYPAKIRAGDSDRVRLTLQVDKNGNITPTAVVGGNVVNGEVVEIPNLYETHRVIAEAKFDIAGVEVSPSGLSNQTLEQGQTITFAWSVRPTEVGIYRGTIWLYLRFVDKVSGEESQKTVAAQDVDIEAVNLFGISANLARTLGVGGSIVGTIVGFPFFEDIVKYIFNRRKRRNS